MKDEECEMSRGFPIKGGAEVEQQTKAGLLQSMLRPELQGIASHTFVLQKELHCLLKLQCSLPPPCSQRQAPQPGTGSLLGPDLDTRAAMARACKPRHVAERRPSVLGFKASRALVKPCGNSGQQMTLPTCFKAKRAD